MRHFIASLPASLLLIPAVALAVNFSEVTDRYADSTSLSVSERVSVNVLTNAGAVSGNPDGTFAPDRAVNRAEFAKVALLSAGKDMSVPTHDCFPDVKHAQWFAVYVCEAKDRGIVEGNPDGLFHPERQVNYAEAVKILVTLHGYSLPLPPPNERWMWYRGYMLAAESHGVLLSETMNPEHPLTRGETVRLAAAFSAQADGQLEDFRRAEGGQVISSSSSSRSSSSRSSTSFSSSSSRASSVSSSTSASYDLLQDVSVTTSTFVLLGRTTPILGSVQAFSATEPIEITDITINVSGSTQAVDAFLIYDSNDGRFIGRATRRTSGFQLDIPAGGFVLERRVQRSLYVRAQLAPYERVQSSGEQFTISSIDLEGNGQWSNDDYSATLTAQNFPTVETTRARITAISNTGQSSTPLFSGTSLPVMKLRIEGAVGDGAAVLQVQELAFRLSSENVTLSNVQLLSPSTGIGTSCSVAGTVVTCSSIPASIGDIQTQRDFELRADVAVTPGADVARLQLFIQDPGTPSSDGDITWTDGEATFTWLPMNTPVVIGTSYTQE